MATPNPLSKTHASTHNKPSVSATTYTIAGILTTVHGLAELPPNIQELAVLWLLHPRLQTHSSMAPLAAQTITHWNSKAGGNKRKGLIAVSFDQRNHGSREVDTLANEAWRQGNKRHAMDMYSSYHGTALDTTLLLSHLPSYLPPALPAPTQHLVLGISLGGHAAWHALLQDPRITTAVVIIGCPDYARLMVQRAGKSRLQTAGPAFLGSVDFPRALVEEVARSDPAGLFLPAEMRAPVENVVDVLPRSAAVREKTAGSLASKLGGKTILNLSGGADKLVPYACGETFVRFLKGAIEPGKGWWRDSGVTFDDRVFAGVGHEMTAEMAEIAVSFIGDVLAVDGGKKASKI